jgi:hypothetical protein
MDARPCSPFGHPPSPSRSPLDPGEGWKAPNGFGYYLPPHPPSLGCFLHAAAPQPRLLPQTGSKLPALSGRTL